MILTTQAELTMLKKGQAREITIPKGRPRPGATKPRCRWVEGRDYVVTARATDTQSERSTRCLVLSITETTDAWTLAVTARASAERSVFLAANPGAQRGDYVFDPARALHDEPEVMGESAVDIIARMAKEDAAVRRPERRPWAA